MSLLCPCVTATDPHVYREQMARIAPFTKRVHIDFSDGEFAPVKLVNPVQAYWPDDMLADLHLMMKRPNEHLETVISLRPHMVIIHAEAEGDLVGMLRQLRAVNIKSGVALLKESLPEQYEMLLAEADHALIFSGDLGHFGGTVDMTLLRKVGQLRSINSALEIGWDGGVALENAAQLSLGGVEVLNAGGAIQRAENPEQVYEDFKRILNL